MADQPAKTHALTVRFSPLELALIRALEAQERTTAAALIRKGVITLAREELDSEEWVRIVKASVESDPSAGLWTTSRRDEELWELRDRVEKLEALAKAFGGRDEKAPPSDQGKR